MIVRSDTLTDLFQKSRLYLFLNKVQNLVTNMDAMSREEKLRLLGAFTSLLMQDRTVVSEMINILFLYAYR